MTASRKLGRRELVGTSIASGLLLGSSRASATAPAAEEPEVTPGEDLMQEHGVLERILLIYDEMARRIDRGEKPDLTIAGNAAALIRHFVEDYHEHTEEQFVFPRLEKAGQLKELVATLRLQHTRGRQLTDQIRAFVKAGASPSLVDGMRAFERMYRPHAAREDTVLFPAFRALIGGAGRELGEQFEEQERKLLGAKGFEGAVAEVARLEERLGIGDLAKFTP